MRNDHVKPGEHPENISEAIRSIERRLDRIEGRLGIAPEAFPPSVPAPPKAAYQPPPIQFAPPAPPPMPPSPPAAKSAAAADFPVDAEMRFGSVVLPRVGAGLILLGIAYLVGLSIARGWITPWHQFYGAIALCLTFIGVGFWKRQERFDFGQVLIGLGSCGLYLACAVGHAFHNLFSGETLVIQFVAISFLNLFYGAATPSRTFVGIGVLGGLIAALLPMRESHVAVSLGLNLAIALPAAAIIGWHKWRAMALAGWAASVTAAAVPMFHPFEPWSTQVGIFYAINLAMLVAYARSHEGWDFDPQAAFLPFAAVLTGVLGFARQGGYDALWHELAMGAGLAAASLVFRGKAPVRSALLLAGLLSAFLLAPIGLEGTQPAWTYLTLGAAAALVSWRALPKAALSFAGIGFGMGIAMYASALFGSREIAMAEELGLLTLALAVLVAGAWSAGRLSKLSEIAVFLGMALASPIVCRMSTLLMGSPSAGLSPETATLIALMGLAGSGAILAMRRQWVLMTFFAWCAFFIGALIYILEAQYATAGLALELSVLAGMLAVAALSGGAAERTGGKEGGAALAGFVGWGIFTRAVFLVATQPSVGMGDNASLTLAWTLYALVLITIGFLADNRALRLTSLAIFGATVGKVLMIDLSALDSAVRVVLLLLLGGGMIAGGYAYVRRTRTLGGPPAGARG